MMQEPMLAKILRWGVYLTAFVPLIIFSQYLSPFHFGKVVVFRSMIEIMLVFYLLLVWQDRSYLPKTNRIFWAFLGFTLAFSLTTITSILPASSFWGSLERMGGLWTFWHYFAFFVIATAVLRERRQWLFFLELSIFSGILSALYGFGQKTDISFFIGSGGRQRIFGTIGNAALFAGYEIVLIFLALALLSRPNLTMGKKIFLGAEVILGSIAVLMTAVRGSVLGLGVGFLIFFILRYVYFRSKTAKRAFLGVVTLALLFFVVVFTPIKRADFIQQSGYLRRITDVSLNTFTVKTRFWAWEAGLKGWSESIKTVIVGWGPENFNIPFSKNFNPKFYTGSSAETLFDRAHNMFVEVLVTMGLLGFLAYLALFREAFRTLRQFIRERSEFLGYAVGFIPLIVAYIIHNSFIFDTSANFVVFFSVLGFITFLGFSEKQQQTPKSVLIPGMLRVVVAIGLCVSVAVLIYRTNIIPAKANYATTRGIIRGWQGDFAGAVAKFKEALSYNSFAVYEFRNRFVQYILDPAQSSKKLTPEYVEVLQYAIREEKKSVEENPPDYLPLLYLSRLNIVLGKDDPASPYNDEALRNSFKALELSPTFVRTYYEIGQAYLNKKDFDNAVRYFERAVGLNPEVGGSYWYLGLIEIERGNVTRGVRLIEKSFENNFSGSESDFLRVVNFFLREENFQALEYIYRNLVSLAPHNPQYHASLAYAYARLGEIDKAVASARQAAKLDPSYEADARAFVRSLGREF